MLYKGALIARIGFHSPELVELEESLEDRFVLINNLLANEASPAEIKASVKELALYGDWIEQKLSEEDAL